MRWNAFVGLLLALVIGMAGCGGGGSSSGGGGGGSSNGNGSSNNSTACMPPATPTGLKVVPKYSDVTGHANSVSWNPVDLGNEAWVHYKVYRSKTPNVTARDYNVSGTWSSPSYRDAAVFEPFLYYYAVSATNACGESDISSSVFADGSSTVVSADDTNTDTTTPPILPAPTNLIVTKTGDKTWELSWDPVDGAEEYFVYDRIGAAPEPTRTAGRYTFTGILDDSYYYDFITDGTSESGTAPNSGLYCWVVAAGIMDKSDSEYHYVGKTSTEDCLRFSPTFETATGRVSIWTNNSTTIDSVYVDGLSVGGLNTFFANGAPSCGQSGTITKTLPVGTHTVKASNSTQSWASTNVTITEGVCTPFKLSGTNTAPPPTDGTPPANGGTCTDPNLIGTWNCRTGDGDTKTITYTSGGTFSDTTTSFGRTSYGSGSYKACAGTVTASTTANPSFSYGYSLSGSELSLPGVGWGNFYCTK